jgi:hypothetical protein
MWEIRSTPEDYRRLGHVDEAAWTWGLTDGSGAPRALVVALSGGAMSLVAADGECPDAIADAHSSEGLSVVEPLLAAKEPPRLVEIDETVAPAELW